MFLCIFSFVFILLTLPLFYILVLSNLNKGDKMVVAGCFEYLRVIYEYNRCDFKSCK